MEAAGSFHPVIKIPKEKFTAKSGTDLNVFMDQNNAYKVACYAGTTFADQVNEHRLRRLLPKRMLRRPKPHALEAINASLQLVNNNPSTVAPIIWILGKNPGKRDLADLKELTARMRDHQDVLSTKMLIIVLAAEHRYDVSNGDAGLIESIAYPFSRVMKLFGAEPTIKRKASKISDTKDAVKGDDEEIKKRSILNINPLKALGAIKNIKVEDLKNIKIPWKKSRNNLSSASLMDDGGDNPDSAVTSPRSSGLGFSYVKKKIAKVIKRDKKNSSLDDMNASVNVNDPSAHGEEPTGAAGRERSPSHVSQMNWMPTVESTASILSLFGDTMQMFHTDNSSKKPKKDEYKKKAKNIAAREIKDPFGETVKVVNGIPHALLLHYFSWSEVMAIALLWEKADQSVSSEQLLALEGQKAEFKPLPFIHYVRDVLLAIFPTDDAVIRIIQETADRCIEDALQEFYTATKEDVEDTQNRMDFYAGLRDFAVQWDEKNLAAGASKIVGKLGNVQEGLNKVADRAKVAADAVKDAAKDAAAKGVNVIGKMAGKNVEKGPQNKFRGGGERIDGFRALIEMKERFDYEMKGMMERALKAKIAEFMHSCNKGETEFTQVEPY